MICRAPSDSSKCDDPTVVHFFAGSGGCTLGLKWAGFRSLGSFDLDPKACRDLERLTGGPAFVEDLARLTHERLRKLTGERAPWAVIMSPPCKKFSGCLPEEMANTDDYDEMAKLAWVGVVLATEGWIDRPAFIVIENVPRITTRGADVLAKLIALLLRAGYTIDQSSHDCGVIGGLAQHRDRYMLVARLPERAPNSLRKPPAQRVRAVGEVLGQLPSPVADHGDEMHLLSLLSPLNWIRLACIDPKRVVSPRSKGDWRDLPPRVRIAGHRRRAETRQGGDEENRHDGKVGVNRWDAPAHTIIGRGQRWCSTWSSVADPRITRMEGEHKPGSRKAKGAPDDYGVGQWDEPHTTIRGRQEVQSSRASVSDPRVAETAISERKSRKNGGRGVEAWDAPAHSVLGEGSVENCRVSTADPRLGCKPRPGVYGVNDDAAPAATILGHHRHDNAAGSVTDPRLSYRSAERVARADRRAEGSGHSGRGDFGVVDSDGPSPTILGHHRVSKSPAALTDDRGWPIPTHELVIEDGEFVLYTLDPDAPPVDVNPKARPCLMVIRAPDGTWHRPMTDRELAALQGFPLDCYLEGPSSTTPRRKATATTPARPARPGRREHIGNAIPPPTAEAIGRAILECIRSTEDGVFLRGGDFWVAPNAEGLAA
jgi:site-specific DNA-cytosine methylase